MACRIARRSIYRLPEGQVRMVEVARQAGASANFAGSGGAIVGLYKDEPKVLQHLLETIAQPVVLFLLAPEQGDWVGVFADTDQLIAEVGFLFELLYVQADQATSQQDSQERAEGGIADRAEEQPGGDRPEDAREAGQRDRSVDEDEDNGERVGGEGLDVLADALVRVVELPHRLDPVIGSVGEVAVEEVAGEPVPPAQAQHLLGEAEEGGHHRGKSEYPSVEESKVADPFRLPFGGGGDQVAVDVTVADIEALDDQNEEEEQSEQSDAPPAGLGLEKRAGNQEKPRPSPAFRPHPRSSLGPPWPTSSALSVTAVAP